MEATQISIFDDVQRRYDYVVDQWGKWRDAQPNDEHKHLVDAIFVSQVRTLELVLAQLGQDVIPF